MNIMVRSHYLPSVRLSSDQNILIDKPPDFNNFLFKLFWKDTDLFIKEMTIDDYLYDFSRTQWMRQDYNLVIMSALYTEPPHLIRIVKMFSLQIWIFIIFEILIITTFLFIKNKFEGMKIYSFGKLTFSFLIFQF